MIREAAVSSMHLLIACATVLIIFVTVIESKMNSIRRRNEEHRFKRDSSLRRNFHRESLSNFLESLSFSPRNATKLETILARCDEFFTPNSLISLSLKLIKSSTPKNLLRLSSYASRSSLWSQSWISKCGRFVITIFFLLSDANRKLHATPEKRKKTKVNQLIITQIDFDCPTSRRTNDLSFPLVNWEIFSRWNIPPLTNEWRV